MRAFDDKNYARGTMHGRSKLTEQQVAELRARHRAGETAKGLAQQFGISQVAAWKIVNGVTWRHVA